MTLFKDVRILKMHSYGRADRSFWNLRECLDPNSSVRSAQKKEEEKKINK